MTNEEKNEKSEKLETELIAAKKLAEEYLNNWKRERADFINYKKEENERISGLIKFGNEGILLEVIDLMDDLAIASQMSADTTGFRQIYDKFLAWLEKHGVKKINTSGAFDPQLHEAVEIEAGGEKMKEIRAGYMLHDKVIRPARIKLIN